MDSIWHKLKLLERNDENTQIELKKVELDLNNNKQKILQIEQENKDLRQKLDAIQLELANIDNNNDGDEEKKEEEIDELEIFLTDEKYKIKLIEYYDILKQEGFIDLDTIKELTDKDLIDININKKAHRIKILRAIKVINQNQNNNND